MSERSLYRADRPTVSVVMPIRNEGANLRRAVASILEQRYPLPLQICLAVAPSTDDTAHIADVLAREHPGLIVIENPSGRTPAGLNAAIDATDGDIIVRVDGHAELSDGYIERAVHTMQHTGAVNVGGVQAARGETPFERAVAAAMTSGLGTGGARFHVGGEPGPVDTVYLGVFARTAGDAVGWFDESLIRNQDYELNIRLRDAGGTIWFDPELAVTYRPRSSIGALARQYYEYGWWKAEVIRRHGGSLKLRQAAPAALPIVLGGATIAAISRRRWLAIPLSYLVGIVAGAVSVGRTGGAPVGHLARVLPTMHLSWGVGFLRSMWRYVRSRAAGRGG